jgi:hypothetical protein
MEGWPAARFLTVLAELQLAERGQRRIEATSRTRPLDV